jgi:hypothetical protein
VVINKTLGVPLDASSLARVLSLTAVLAALSWWLEESGSMLLVEFALLGMLYLALLPIAGLLGRADLEPFLPKWASRAG